jgi:hypothetical protein
MISFSNRHNKSNHIKRNTCKPRSIIHARVPNPQNIEPANNIDTQNIDNQTNIQNQNINIYVNNYNIRDLINNSRIKIEEFEEEMYKECNINNCQDI